MKDIGGLGTIDIERQNKPPTVKIDGDAVRTVALGAPLALDATVIDDGIPEPKAAARSNTCQLQCMGPSCSLVRVSRYW